MLQIIGIIGIILIFVWLVGLIFNLFGGLIHIILVVGAILFVWDFFFGKKSSRK